MKKDLKCYKENLGLYLLRWFVNFVYDTITGIYQNFKLPGVPNFCDFKKVVLSITGYATHIL